MTRCPRERARKTVDFLIRFSINHVIIDLNVQEEVSFLNFLRFGSLVFGLLSEMAAVYILGKLSVRAADLLNMYYPLNVPVIHIHAATYDQLESVFEEEKRRNQE